MAWGGACSGGTCSVTMTQDRTVTANFKRTDKTLTVTVSGTGTVTSSPAGINAPGDNTETYAHGTMVTLTAAWNATSHTFAWSGACTGSTATCVVTMDQARSVTATFTIRTYTLTVAKAGFGTGTVQSTMPAGIIDCGADCSEVVSHGTMVTLTATPSGGGVFFGWSGGGCSGTGTCTTTVTAATTVTATFDRCVRSTQACSSNQFMQCDATGNFVSHVVPNGGAGGTSATITYDGTYVCPMGCHASEPRCLDVSAVNGLNAALDSVHTSPSGVDLLIDDTSGTTTINLNNYSSTTGQISFSEPGGQQHTIDATRVTQANGRDIIVLKVRTFTLAAGARLNVRGTAAFGLASHFDVYIAGHLDLSGASLGAGISTNGTTCNGGNGAPATGGAGHVNGGGHASSGASGGNSFTGANPNLQPLEGGCIGGIANVTFTGGRGGGSLAFVSRTRLTVAATGVINVSGARGTGHVDSISGGVFALGGGSGGGVIMEAPSVAFSVGARVNGRGGSGAAGRTTTQTIAHGNNGDWDLNAPTVPGATCANCGTGGAGGLESMQPGNGIGASPQIGGGGGAAGRAFVRDRGGSFTAPAGTTQIFLTVSQIQSR
ncbi:MAG: hypothetical protein HS111_03225 [Kofleriaceae bacterium]|nr:hypothetical protein [Kofleriaceae bacterium]